MSEENNGRMTEGKWAEFKRLRDEFKEAFKDEDEDNINCALQDLPANIRGEEDDDKSYRVNWDGCTLHNTACYYANKVLDKDDDMPICGIEELKERIKAL